MKTALFFYPIAVVPLFGAPIAMFGWFWLGVYYIPAGKVVTWTLGMVVLLALYLGAIWYRKVVRKNYRYELHRFYF